jgi:hypothetical protein
MSHLHVNSVNNKVGAEYAIKTSSAQVCGLQHVFKIRNHRR